MLDSTNIATFGEGTIQDVANLHCDVIIDKLREGSLELSPYAKDIYTAKVYTLAFGGPGARLTILYNTEGDVMRGVYEYGESSGSAAVPIGKRDAEELDRICHNNDNR